MKPLRHALAVAVALAAVSAAPGDAQQKDAHAQPDGARREAARRYFAAPAAAPAPAGPAEGRQESPQKMIARLKAENANLRKENKDLRADNDAMAQKLEEYEVREMRRRQNRGALVVPPQAPQAQPGNAVPPNWRPFEFNGATYYVVPLKAERAPGDNDGTKTNTLMQLEPARPEAPAK